MLSERAAFRLKWDREGAEMYQRFSQRRSVAMKGEVMCNADVLTQH